jgi:signal transduction histidine kinase
MTLKPAVSGYFSDTASTAIANFPRHDQVHAQLVAALYSRTNTIAYSHLVAGLFTVGFLSFKIPLPWLLIWFGALVALSVARLVSFHQYKRAAPPVEKMRRWGYYFLAMSTGTGVFWTVSGMLALEFSPPDPVVSIFVLTLFFGYVSGAAASGLAGYLLAFFLFAIPMMTSLMIAFVLRGGELHLTLAGMAAIFLLFQIFYALNARSMLVQSILVRFENINLIEELRQKRSEAEAANVAKSKFLAAASHDLRQPLHALTLFVSALTERTRFTDLSKVVDNIGVSAQALEKLFGALLDISRLDAGVIQPRLCSFRLQELFDLLRNDYALEAQHKGLVFNCPPCDAVVHTDPQLLERILRNYLSNAIRYSSRGEITLRSGYRDGTVCIEVADNGKGIPRDKQEEIFREFHQLENPERDRTKGLGLGLAIVDRLAKLLDHPIGVESTAQQGSVFHVTVPEGAVDTAVSLHTALPEISTDLSGMLVLVIDDEISIREGMNTLLGQWGCDLILASSEDEAVELLRRGSVVPDVVIADYRLRENKTGVQAIRRVHAECGIAVPALIIAGDTAPDRLREVAASGFPMFHKPVAPAQLRAFLHQSSLPN